MKKNLLSPKSFIHIVLQVLICSFLLGFEVMAIPQGSPFVKNFNRQIYKSGTQNWHIASGNTGFMYFGNNKGLLEYDGTRWETYRLPNHSIVRSFVFSDNKIFIGGQNEIGFLSTDDRGAFTYQSLRNKIPERGLIFDDIWKTFSLKGDIIFCSEKEILIFSNDTIEIIDSKSGSFENFFQVENQLWVQEISGDLLKFNGDRLVKLKGSEIFKNNRIVSIIEGFKSKFSLIITRNGGLFLYDNLKFEEFQIPLASAISEAKPYCAIALQNGDIAIGTSQNGLFILDREGSIKLHVNTRNGLQNNTILSLFQDKHNNMWLGLDNGIDYVEINSPFRTIATNFGVFGTGYSSSSSENYLLLGTNQGLFRAPVSASKNGYSNSSFDLIDDAIGQVWSIDKIRNEIYVSKHDGAYVYDDKRIRKFSEIEGSWKFEKMAGHKNKLIQGAYDGFYIYENEDNKMPQLKNKVAGFRESARVFEQDELGRIWVSHAYKGLFRLELNDNLDSIINFEVFDTTNGLPNNLFINVAKIRNEIIFTTTSGIYSLDADSKKFVLHEDFTEVFGPNRNVHRLIEDELGNIWFSIDNEFGLLHIHEKGVFNDYEILYFNQIHNYLVDGFEDIFAINDRYHLIGTENGFMIYDSDIKSMSDINYSSFIREVTLTTDIDSIFYFGGFSIDKEIPEYNLSYDQNDLKFYYSSPYFDKMDYIEYRYRLTGFENSWSDWSGKTEKEYTNLNPGKYTFLVESKNAYGEVSSPSSFSFEIKPPWFFNVYSKIAYFLVSVLILFLIIRFIYKREANKRYQLKIDQNRKLKNKEEEFQREFEKSESEIVKLRNEKLQADVKHKNSQLASATMHLVQKSEILNDLKKEIQTLIKEAPSEFRRKLSHISRAIDEDIQLDNNWEQFELYFDQVHENFFKRLRQKYPELTPKDQKLCAYLRMNLSTKEIAPLLNISVRGVEISRYRLRKKLELDSNENLVSHIMDI